MHRVPSSSAVSSIQNMPSLLHLDLKSQPVIFRYYSFLKKHNCVKSLTTDFIFCSIIFKKVSDMTCLCKTLFCCSLELLITHHFERHYFVMGFLPLSQLSVIYVERQNKRPYFASVSSQRVGLWEAKTHTAIRSMALHGKGENPG